jgi:hypothetical protein
MKSIRKRIPAITVVLLGALAFFFLHSELGLPKNDGADHGTHDYCALIKNNVTHQKPVKNESAKIVLNSQSCPYPSFDQDTRKRGSAAADYPENVTLGETYILNRTIRI